MSSKRIRKDLKPADPDVLKRVLERLEQYWDEALDSEEACEDFEAEMETVASLLIDGFGIEEFRTTVPSLRKVLLRLSSAYPANETGDSLREAADEIDSLVDYMVTRNYGETIEFDEDAGGDAETERVNLREALTAFLEEILDEAK
jgi:hypothetical protein